MSTISLIPTVFIMGNIDTCRGLQEVVAQGVKDPLHFGLARRLSSVRCYLDLPATAVSARAGLSASVAGEMEDAKHLPRLHTVERVAAALGVSPCWLAFGHHGGDPIRKRRPRLPVPLELPEPVTGGVPFQSLYLGMPRRLRTQRAAQFLSLRQLAEPAGLSFEQIRKCENGATVARVDTCERLAIALGCSPCWLAYGLGTGN